ncbi:hypothetical protein BDV23DRAFT_185885 [Aspergillus alliaceus]|uniref:Uncharacterized protein n=1 Tax=Petromyces alliaceus TaxID=209559 RepID=A0A5N7C1C6_PETAA|nr:hypothetical protein BDV23DRAFT_185885 [Aspergillus alliaceus]
MRWLMALTETGSGTSKGCFGYSDIRITTVNAEGFVKPWWAWLRQDAWVAMRERRRVFSFWRLKKHSSTLTIPELSTRAIYLLAQFINYASREESQSTDMERGSELIYMLQEWQDSLPRQFSPLPVPSNSDVFPPPFLPQIGSTPSLCGCLAIA